MKRFVVFVLSIVLTGVLLLTASALAVTVGYGRTELLVETQWLDQHLGDANLRLVDTRRADKYQQGHIPGAVNLLLAEVTMNEPIKGMAILPEKFAQIMSRLGISTNTQVIVYDDSQGLWASRLFWLLEYYGHEKVALLNGGYPQCVAENREVTKLLPDISPHTFISSADPTRLATREYILSTRGREEVFLVDARSPAEYKGGHIPGAVNISWLNGVDGEPAVFKGAQELYRLYYEAGAGPDKEIITYCQTGVRAAHSYFQLRLLGYESVRVYDGSWEEWGSDADIWTSLFPANAIG